MPSSCRPIRPFLAQVLPLLSSSSRSSDSQIAKASSKLWKKLVSSSQEKKERGRICVAVEWPEDRRLGNGKERSLVIWVERDEVEEVVNISGAGRLYVHPSLLPPFSITPLSVLVHLHEPFELTLAIVQPVLEHPDDPQIEGDIDLSSLYGVLLAQKPHPYSYPPIIRQNDHLPLPSTKLRVLLLEPVSQGILTPSTRIILSTEPHILSQQDHLEDIDGYEVKSSYSRTHMSLDNFDPDAFLSSDLSLSLFQPTGAALPDGSGEDDLVKSVSSSTSGSLTPRPGDRPISPPAALDELIAEEVDRGTKFSPVMAQGGEEDVCWLGVIGLGRAGIFEGDWVYLRSGGHGESSSSGSSRQGRLVKALAWERLDEYDDELPPNPILLPPSLHHSLLPTSSSNGSIIVQPTPFGARSPTLPTAKTLTVARIATSEGIDKRYERSWLKGLKAYLSINRKGKGKSNDDSDGRLVRRGDIISVPVYISKPLGANEIIDDQVEEDEDDYWCGIKMKPTAVVYFTITSLSYDPLVPPEEDFRSTLSSKARAGELGCWFDEGTKMVLTGVEKERIGGRQGDQIWHGIDPAPPPFSLGATTKLRDLLQTPFVHPSLSSLIQLSVLVKGARGSGKRSLIRSVADELGYNIINVECYDIIGDSPSVTSGTLLAKLEKAKLCSPSLLVLNHVEALAKKSESNTLGRPPPIVKVLEEIISSAKASTDWPVVVMGTTVDVESVPNELVGCFKQDVEIRAPNEPERLKIITHLLSPHTISPDVDLKEISRQTAALHAGDIAALLHRSYDLSLKRIASSPASSGTSAKTALLAGMSISAQDLKEAIDQARSAYSDSIGAPKIPNVTWDDVGGLANIKKDILDTVQLPLERGELFGEGLKKRSGILLYGPPGTGKTLLAKAVATSCSLNFLSVKGPELLNMYIGESEANVRRLFQRARDASPCIIFMDELDSVAPKRGNQGDSGGVMDRIVSQLLAELDGMSQSSNQESSSQGPAGAAQVFVLGATNRPDLLDSALLRPGRFDKMLYLNIPSTNKEQLDIIRSLTRKFTLDPRLKLEDVVQKLEFNLTGADLYALCSDAMLGAMSRVAEGVDREVERLNGLYGDGGNACEGNMSEQDGKKKLKKTWRGDLTVQYYLSKIANPQEIQVKVSFEDFERAREKLVPSVSKEELDHYERVQKQFKSFSLVKDKDKDNQSHGGGESSEVNGRNGGVDVNGDGFDEDVDGGEEDLYELDAGMGKGKEKEADGDLMSVDWNGKGKGKAKQVDGDGEEVL
ncbi:hypothetical protein I302_108063 [Kwoniella bestiolae CBS 10118]|uniref:Peroxisomal ATPase PEX6 n=1 Tax=Kwoniella bestiolae CBS 10118 TaxID=1296100 RepID=A0A1B9FWS1_9TREE|nr:hypothetical protein I302_07571 [Kwoniella bestiolae CBS 10118]OCF23217.1 hypothetical protein I302_07571 [Kwoniella bestiolae CBS 10118]